MGGLASSLDASLTLAPGRKLGRYAVVRRLAVGGMAELHVARILDSTEPNPYVVIKRVLPHLSADPEFVGRLLDDFGARDFVPDDCPDCIADGHVTGLIDYALERDPNLRVAAISSWYDSVISQTFLMLDPATFATDVDSETTELLEAHPERYRRFLYEGQAHTALLNNVNGVIGGDFTAVEFPPGVLMMLSGLSIESMYSLESEGVLLRDWVAAMLENDLDGWVDVRPDPGPPPTMDEPAP